MNTGTVILAGIIGSFVAIILGYLCFGVIFAEFYEANAGSATGVIRSESEILWIPVALGHLGLSFLLAIVFSRWANISTFKEGIKAGFIIGFLVAISAVMLQLGTTHFFNATASIVDIGVKSIIYALVGGIVGAVLGRSKK